MDRQTLTEIMTRVSRREMQVPDAVEAIMNAGRQVAETSAPQPEVPERSGPPEGILTTANAMETPRNGAPDVPDVPEHTDGESTDASEQTDEEPDELIETLREEGYEVVERADVVRQAIEDQAIPDDPFAGIEDDEDEVDFEADEGLMRSLNPDLNEEA